MSADTPSPEPVYRELAPPPPLAGDLVCTWMQLVGDAPHPQRVLPDACVDIVWIGDAPPVIVGPATGMFIAPLPARARVLGARFRPGMAPRLLGLPADALLDLEVPLREAWGAAAEATLTARLAETPTPERALALVEQALQQRLAGARPADRLVAAAVAELARDPAARLDALCRSAGISARQLRRRFDAAVGYGPKRLHRVLRFQRVLALAGRGGPPPGLAALALRAGYADQAHMTREVCALSGRAPSALLQRAASTLAMADFFKTIRQGED